MKRENLVSTEISPFAALPHCLIDGESFFVFVLMKNPVPWGKANVRLVILGCFKRGDEKIKEVLARMELSETVRGETLTLEQFAQLADLLRG